MLHKLKQIMILPFEDFFSGLESCLKQPSAFNIALIVISFLASWWIYVPVHELGHAVGCILGGGTVSRLEISPLYAGAVLEKIFPFVFSGSEYAGQLTGFDTNGNDLIYLLTVIFPYFLTVFIGVPLLRSAARSSPPAASLKLGFALPIAFAPFISVSGDYYEMGSIIVTRLAGLLSPSFDVERLRSDDLFKLVSEIFLSGSQFSIYDIIGVACSFLLGVALIYLTYLSGVLWSKALSAMVNKNRSAESK